MKDFLRPILGIFLLAALRCSPPPASTAPPEPIQLSGVRWPVSVAEEVFNGPPEFEAARRMFYVESAKGIPLSKLVRLDIFDGFEPGLTFEQATQRYGKPKSTRSERDKRVATYERSNARIEVQDQKYESTLG